MCEKYVLLRKTKNWCELELSLTMNSTDKQACFSPNLEVRLQMAQTHRPPTVA